MEKYVKTFYELTNDELYEILTLRHSVFILEQECFYEELDNNDQGSIHVFIKDEGEIIAYARVLDKGVSHDEYAAIGRVIAKRRGQGYGREVMELAIEACKNHFDSDGIYIEAQTYAKDFYNNLGFKQISDSFDLDGIPHIEMLLEY